MRSGKLSSCVLDLFHVQRGWLSHGCACLSAKQLEDAHADQPMLH